MDSPPPMGPHGAPIIMTKHGCRTPPLPTFGAFLGGCPAAAPPNIAAQGSGRRAEPDLIAPNSVAQVFKGLRYELRVFTVSCTYFVQLFAIHVTCIWIICCSVVQSGLVMVASKDWPTNRSHRPAPGTIFHPCRGPHQCTSRTPRTPRKEVAKKGEHVWLAASKTEKDPDCHAPSLLMAVKSPMIKDYLRILTVKMQQFILPKYSNPTQIPVWWFPVCSKWFQEVFNSKSPDPASYL